MKKTLKNITVIRTNTFVLLAVSFLFAGVTSCEKLELPETDSIADLTPPSAGFNTIATDDYLTFDFSNTSKSATDFAWNFGDGTTSSEKNPEHTFEGLGIYNVTLVASDKKNESSTYSADVEILELPLPTAIRPEIEHADFNESSSTPLYAPWKPYFSNISASSSPFGGSADGEYVNYDGTPSDSKTRACKWQTSYSANADGTTRGSGSRFAKQAITVSPDRVYFLEYSYAIEKTGGDQVVVSILDGHFPNGDDAYASANSSPILKTVGNEFLGKGNFTLVKQRFTAPSSGLVTIWMYGVMDNGQGWIDNLKIYQGD
ncbi:PKD domain-containing protein [Flavobacteriaceae bacterium]|nr:PKD domain-containing protein [Flavobacteriaceae bacterium]